MAIHLANYSTLLRHIAFGRSNLHLQHQRWKAAVPPSSRDNSASTILLSFPISARHHQQDTQNKPTINRESALGQFSQSSASCWSNLGFKIKMIQPQRFLPWVVIKSLWLNWNDIISLSSPKTRYCAKNNRPSIKLITSTCSQTLILSNLHFAAFKTGIWQSIWSHISGLRIGLVPKVILNS